MAVSIVVVGLNHKTAPISLLERLAIGEDEIPKALHQLATYEHVLEGSVLSTCNRIEAYAVVSKFHAGSQDLRNFFAEFCHVAPEDFTDHLYTYHDEAALAHLFRVASGIDSMVLGESEILGQVRRAFHLATDEGTAHRVLGTAFRHALRAGKRARSETEIGRNPVSISSAAVELARRAWPSETLAGKRVAIVGAGKMGRLAARALATAGASDVAIVNRTEERGKDLAGIFDASFRPWDELAEVIAESDIVICSTTAPQTVIDGGVIGDRSHKPLFIVDIAVPRDVDPAVGAQPGVVLRDIDDLRGVVEAGMGRRVGEISKVEDIVAQEVAHFMEWERASDIAPTIYALVAKAESIRLDVVDRSSNTSGIDRDELDRITKKIVAKLLHEPLNKAKELSSSKQGHVYLAALRELFGLDDELYP